MQSIVSQMRIRPMQHCIHSSSVCVRSIPCRNKLLPSENINKDEIQLFFTCFLQAFRWLASFKVSQNPSWCQNPVSAQIRLVMFHQIDNEMYTCNIQNHTTNERHYHCVSTMSIIHNRFAYDVQFINVNHRMSLFTVYLGIRKATPCTSIANNKPERERSRQRYIGLPTVACQLL